MSETPFKERMIKLASERTWGDSLNSEDSDAVVDDYAGGNVDDAYYGGERAGATDIAREVCNEMGWPYTIEDD